MLGISELYFLAVAQSGSFTEAAQALFVSQPAVSKQVLLMEKRLGYKLLNRSTRKIELTKRGEVLFDALAECQTIWEGALARAEKTDEDEAKINLRIGVLSGWSSQMPPLSNIRAIQREFPHVNITVQQYTYTEMLNRLLDRKLDLLLTVPIEIPKNAPVEYGHACYLDLVMYASAAQPLARKAKFPADLGGMRAFVMDKSASLCSLDHVGEYIKSHNLNLILTGMPNIDSIYTAIEQGQGVGFTMNNSRVCSSKSFKTFKIENSERELVFAWHAYNRSPAVSAFLKSFLPRFDNKPYRTA